MWQSNYHFPSWSPFLFLSTVTSCEAEKQGEVSSIVYKPPASNYVLPGTGSASRTKWFSVRWQTVGLFCMTCPSQSVQLTFFLSLGVLLSPFYFLRKSACLLMLDIMFYYKKNTSERNSKGRLCGLVFIIFEGHMYQQAGHRSRSLQNVLILYTHAGSLVWGHSLHFS